MPNMDEQAVMARAPNQMTVSLTHEAVSPKSELLVM